MFASSLFFFFLLTTSWYKEKSMLLTPQQCIAFSLMIASWSIPNVAFPAFRLDVLGGVNISSLTCRGADFGSATVTYNSSDVAISARGTAAINCSANVVTSGGNESNLHVGLVLPPGAVRVATSMSDLCLTESAAVEQCTLVPKLDLAYLLPLNEKNLLLDALLFPLLEAVLNRLAPSLFCDGIVADLVEQLTNHSLDPMIPLPPPLPGTTQVEGFALFKTLITAANSIPVVFGLRLAAEQLPDHGNALQLNISFPNGLAGYDNSSSAAIGIRVPSGVTLSSDVLMQGLTCIDAAHCYMNPCGLAVLNVRMTGGGGAVDRFVTNVLGVVIADVVRWAVDPRHLPPSSTSCMNETMELYAPSKPVNKLMHPLAAALVGAGLAVLAGLALREYSRQTKASKLFTHGEPKQDDLEARNMRRAEDKMLIILCFICAYAFIWASTSTSAEVVLADDIVLYSFTLSIIHDLYVAGLKALSLLVTVTSGVIPYVKLFVTMYIGIIQNRPDSNYVAVVNVLGKLTYLDRFALMITMTRLHVQGVADVTLLPSFYVFLLAVVLSTVLTNRVIFRQPLGQNSSSAKCPSASSTSVAGSSFRKNRKMLISIFATAVSASCCAACCVLSCVRYDIGGVLNIITGPRLYYSVMALFSSAPVVLFGVAFFSVVIAPILLSLSFAFSPLMISWCATDTFLIACVAGLTQLEDFIAFIISDPTLNSMYTASAVLLWPLALLGIATCVQWGIIVDYFAGRRHDEKPERRPLIASTTSLERGISIPTLLQAQ